MKIEPNRPARTGAASASRPASEAVRAYGAGAATSAPAPVADAGSIAGIPEAELTPKVRQALDMLLAEVQRMRDDLQQAQKRISFLERLADEDSLVPVANRRAFVRELSRMVAYSERYGTRSSVLYFDIDGFKQINDAFGHAAGDQALRHVADILAANIRESDVVGRLGGDEFGIILAQANAADAAEKASALAEVIAATPLAWEGRQIALRVSFGAYSFTGREDAGEALKRADQAMYASKQDDPGR